MNKFNVGDKVRIKEDLSECEFGYTPYMEEFAGKEATVVKVCSGGNIRLDIDKQVWDWSENVLELIERNKVNESDLKDADVESITIRQALQSIYDIPPQIKINSDKIKEVEDVVNHPSHYTDGNIEVMDFIEDKQLNFARGNVIKYVSRAGKKDPNKELEDLLKSMWYLNREIERLKKLQDKNNE
jgi:hypothetical protein